MSVNSAARRHPETVAAFVNALVVLVLPPALIVFGMTFFPSNSLGTTVYAHDSFAASAARFVEGLVVVEIPLVPFAVLAAWRTWVHVKRYFEGGSDGGEASSRVAPPDSPAHCSFFCPQRSCIPCRRRRTSSCTAAARRSSGSRSVSCSP